MMKHSFSEAAELAELINRAKYAKRISNGSTGATPVNFHPRIGTCGSGLTVDKSMQSTAMENYLLSCRHNKLLDNNKLITLPHRNNC